MRKVIAIATICLVHLAVSQAAFSQFNISIPKVPKINKPKTDKDGSGNTSTNTTSNNTNNDAGRPKNAGGNLLYPPQRPNGTPVFLKNSVVIKATVKDASSWVPVTKVLVWVNDSKTLNYQVDYLKPDGSPWYSEKLEQSTQTAERCTPLESPSPWGGVLDTKATPATGVFGFKITDKDANQVVYQGKFKVGKFATNGPKKVDFYVDHDWLMPIAVLGFHHSQSEIGGESPLLSVWIKGRAEANELEARVFYKGQQVASSKDGGGVSDYDERTSEMSAAFSPSSFWKRWEFQWTKFLVDGNGSFNHDNYPGAFYVDKNPGDYTVKIYRSGAQIRELSFSVGADGRFVQPSYTSQIFMPYYRIILPVKVIGGSEKWNVNDWKTDAFYGNPLTGFVAP